MTAPILINLSRRVWHWARAHFVPFKANRRMASIKV